MSAVPAMRPEAPYLVAVRIRAHVIQVCGVETLVEVSVLAAKP